MVWNRTPSTRGWWFAVVRKTKGDVMRYLQFILLICLFSCSDQRFQKEKLVFQLSPAQTEFDVNLKMMTFYNSNDKFFIHDSVLLDNNDIASASVTKLENRSVVEVILTNVGREKFAMITEEYTGKNLGMIVDGILVSAPLVNAKITKGLFIIIGFFSPEEASRIAKGISAK